MYTHTLIVIYNTDEMLNEKGYLTRTSDKLWNFENNNFDNRSQKW